MTTIAALALGCSALALPTIHLAPTLGRMGSGRDVLDVVEHAMPLTLCLAVLGGAVGAFVGYVVWRLRSRGAAAVVPVLGGAAYGAIAAALSHAMLHWAGNPAESVVAGGMLGGIFGGGYALLTFVPLAVAVAERTRPTLASHDVTGLFWALWLLAVDATVLLTLHPSPAAIFTRILAVAGIATAVVIAAGAFSGFLRRDRWLGRVRAGVYPTLRVRRLTLQEQLEIMERDPPPYGDWDVLALHSRPNAAVDRGVFGETAYRSAPTATEAVTFVRI